MFKVAATARVEEAPGFQRMFAANRLTLGLFFPIEAFARDQPTMRDQERLAVRAQALEFAALWFRDVPLRHPLHVAKAAASVDQLSRGRLVLGVASGDRPVEFPAFGVDIKRRAALFREAFEALRRVLETEFPVLKTSRGVLTGAADLVPKPMGRLPLLVTGNSGQPLPWIAAHSDGWITYPRSTDRQAETVARWRAHVQQAAPGRFKPFAQSLYIDLDADPQLPPTPIHLGFESGRHFLLRFLEASRGIGVNHVILNLKYGARPAAEVLEEIGVEVLPALARAGNETSTATADGTLA